MFINTFSLQHNIFYYYGVTLSNQKNGFFKNILVHNTGIL